LACFKPAATPKLDTAKLKTLNDSLHADALLLCQVGEMNAKDSMVFKGSLIFSKFFSATSFRVHFILVRPQDGAVLWEAEANARKEAVTDSNGMYGGATNGDEGRMAIAGAALAVNMLVADLNGTANPADILSGVKPTPDKK